MKKTLVIITHSRLSMKFMILGYSRHGKTTLAQWLQEKLETVSIDSSMAAAETVVFPVLGPIYGYANWQECHDDRNAHKEEWFNIIRAYNTPDKTRLARFIYEEKQADIYTGLRCKEEFLAIKQWLGKDLFTIWVDASERVPAQLSSSCTVSRDLADYVFDNNKTDVPSTDANLYNLYAIINTLT